MALHDALDDYDEDEDGAIARTYLTLRVGDERYAIGVASVTEIVRLQRTYAMPDVPRYVRGVINLRGRVLPLVDVRRRIDLEDMPYTDRTLVIVLTGSDSVMTGLVVDSVDDVVEIPEEALQPAGQRGPHQAPSVVSSVGKVGDDVYFIMNIGALLKEPASRSTAQSSAETGSN